MLAKARRWWGLLQESLDLLLTLDPGSGGYKVFGRPGYGGGPGTKRALLDRGAARPGEPYSTVICLSAVTVPVFVLRLLKARGAKVHVNQNGVYYPLWSRDYVRRNRFLARLNAAATHSFFQSEFSVESYRRWVGEPPAGCSILYNGVDRSVFHPREQAGSGPQRILVFLDFRASTAALWRYVAALVPLVSDARWVFLGRADNPSLLEELRRSLPEGNVEWHAGAADAEIPAVLRSCDVALHLVYNDVCPNKVLECLASGVPVICSSAGGAAELVRGGGGVALPVAGGYEKASYPEPTSVLAALEEVRRNPAATRAAARAASERFDLAAWTKTMTGARAVGQDIRGSS